MHMGHLFLLNLNLPCPLCVFKVSSLVECTEQGSSEGERVTMTQGIGAVLTLARLKAIFNSLLRENSTRTEMQVELKQLK